MKKLTKTLSIALCLVIVLSIMAACSSLVFDGKSLPAGTVGVDYEQVIAVDDDNEAEEVTYTLQEGSTLPAGLSLSSDGTISGTPSRKTDGEHSFKVIASAEGYGSKTSEFKIKVDGGAVAYSGSEIKIAVNSESSATVATATNAVDVTYSIKEGSNPLPTGLALRSDGIISGICETEDQVGVKITVVATAVDCTSAEAEFTVKIVKPSLDLLGRTLATGNVDRAYTVLIAAENENVSIFYALKDGDSLPAGLIMENDGFIHGTPTSPVSAKAFTVIASADGFEDTEAGFEISVRKASVQSEVSSSVTFKLTAAERRLTEGYRNSVYLLMNTITATVGNKNTITYKLKSGSKLPAGIELYENGTLYGTPTEGGTFNFTVVASAAACTSAETTFSLVINAPKLIYSGMTAKAAYKNESYTYSLATAYTADNSGAVITYRRDTSVALPAGLSFASDGLLTGTPQKYAKSSYFYIYAEAEGYSSTRATVYITIYDEIKTLSDGIMEAEYIYMDDKGGTGWSGSQVGAGMIEGSQDASNNRYIGWTHTVQSYTFVFDAAAVAGCTVSVRLASELGTITLNPSIFGILLNGVEIPYGSITVSGPGAETMGSFQEFTLPNSLSLLAEQNTITLSVKSNTLLQQGGARTGGPAIDYVKVTTSTKLTWRPYSFNLGDEA